MICDLVWHSIIAYMFLEEVLGLRGLSGVDFSFGLDRLYDVMDQQQLFGSVVGYTTEILLTNIEVKIEAHLLQVLNQLRLGGFKTAVYPQHAKLHKQLAYAHKKGIPFVIMQGAREYAIDSYTLKNMQTGVQACYNWPELMRVLNTTLK